jgi:hypothetical protein
MAASESPAYNESLYDREAVPDPRPTHRVVILNQYRHRNNNGPVEGIRRRRETGGSNDSRPDRE